MTLNRDDLLRYDAEEAKMKSALSVPAVQAFSPTTFDQISWPYKVATPRDLVRYADWNYHPGARDYFLPNAYLPTQCASLQFTSEEAALLRKVSSSVASTTRGLGREVRPVTNHLAQIGPFRIIQEIKRRIGLNELTVFDVGAGTAYQSALLSHAGERVLSMDNAQGLYLWQSAFLENCGFETRYRDWLRQGPPQEIRDFAIHCLPWWEYLELRKSTFQKVDIFFCNNNLGEMNYSAAAFTANLAVHMMAESKVGIFLFTCLGAPKQNGIEMIDALLKQTGFRNLQWGPFWAYAGPNSPLSADVFEFANQIPRWRGRPGESLLTVLDVLDVNESTLPVDLEFAAATGVFDIRKYIDLQ